MPVITSALPEGYVCVDVTVKLGTSYNVASNSYFLISESLNTASFVPSLLKEN